MKELIRTISYRNLQSANWGRGKTTDRFERIVEQELSPVGWIHWSWSGRWQRRIMGFIGIVVRAGGGEGGCSPPRFWATQIFLGSERKFGQSQFLKMSPCLFNYFEGLSINLKSAWWVIYIFAVFYCWALYCTALPGMGYFQSWID